MSVVPVAMLSIPVSPLPPQYVVSQYDGHLRAVNNPAQCLGTSAGSIFATRAPSSAIAHLPTSCNSKRRRVEGTSSEYSPSVEYESPSETFGKENGRYRSSNCHYSTANRLLNSHKEPSACAKKSSAVNAACHGPTQLPIHAQPAPSRHDTGAIGKRGEKFWGRLDKKKNHQISLTPYMEPRGYDMSRRSLPDTGSTEGFRNLGNTCYISAGLQALLGLTPFAVDLGSELDARGGQVRKSDRTVTAAMLAVLAQTRKSGRQGTMDPSRIKDAVQDRFRGTRQQDVQDFLEYFLDKVDEERESHVAVNACMLPLSTASSSAAAASTADYQTAAEASDADAVCIVPGSPSAAAFRHSDAEVITLDGTDDEDADGTTIGSPPAAVSDSVTEAFDDSFPEEVLAYVAATEAAEVGRSEVGPVWDPTSLANRNFGCEILQRRQCPNAVCRGSANPIRGYFRSIPLSLELPPTVPAGADADLTSVQSLLDRFFADETVEYDCEGCGEKSSTIKYSVAQLPRVLCLHIKRFASSGGKIQRPIQLERFVTMAGFCGPQTLNARSDGLTPEVLATAARATIISSMPHSTPKRQSIRADNQAAVDDGAGAAESPVVSKRLDFESGGSDRGKSSYSARKARENREIQQAIEASLLEQTPRDPTTMSESEQLEWAMTESVKVPSARDTIEDTPWRGGDYNGGAVTGSGESTYRLVSFIQHTGKSAGLGHYIAVVWNPVSNTWKEYDDALVKEVDEKAIFGSQSRAQSAYVLFYALVSCLPPP